MAPCLHALTPLHQYRECKAMTTIMPEGKAASKAVKWISGELQEDPNRSIQILINDAVLHFDLSPKEAEFLSEFYRKDKMVEFGS
jgi:hypothetical protein